jgi:hypothetical protein
MNKTRRWLILVAAGALAAAFALAAPAHADPAPPPGPACGAPGAPPCAPGLQPDQFCALIAWRTWMPCNWFGVQVPTGTPGSWG